MTIEVTVVLMSLGEKQSGRRERLQKIPYAHMDWCPIQYLERLVSFFMSVHLCFFFVFLRHSSLTPSHRDTQAWIHIDL